MVTTWISVSVTPTSVAPLASPGPHGDGSVPNITPPPGVVSPVPFAGAAAPEAF